MRVRGYLPPHNFTIKNIFYVYFTNKPLFVKDAALDPEWDSNEDLAEFGMGNYLGYPIHDDRGNVFGTVGVLDNTVRDYSSQDKAIAESLPDAAEETLQTYLQRQSPP